MYVETKRPWVLSAAVAVLVAVAGSLAIAEEQKVERRKVVVKTGEGPDEVFVWEGGGDVATEGAGRSWLGLGLREETKLSEGGARVTTVVEGSPADKAGIKEGDVIVGFQGDVIRGPAKLTERIHETKPGQSVSLEVVRDGSRRTVTAEIGERKSVVRIFGPGMTGESLTEEQKRELELQHQALEDSLRGLGGEAIIELEHGKTLDLDRKALEESLRNLRDTMPELERKLADLERLSAPRAFAFSGPGRFFVDMGGPKLGVELVEATPELREHLGGKPDAGVLVGKVLPGSAAEKAGLKVGDLIVRAADAAIEDAGDLVEAVRGNAGKTVNLEVIRDGRSTTIKAAIPKPASDDAPRGPRAAVWVAPAPPATPAPPARPAAPATPAPASNTTL